MKICQFRTVLEVLFVFASTTSPVLYPDQYFEHEIPSWQSVHHLCFTRPLNRRLTFLRMTTPGRSVLLDGFFSSSSFVFDAKFWNETVSFDSKKISTVNICSSQGNTSIERDETHYRRLGGSASSARTWFLDVSNTPIGEFRTFIVVPSELLRVCLCFSLMLSSGFWTRWTNLGQRTKKKV